MADPTSPPGPDPMPAAELEVDLAFVRALVDRQFPQYRDAVLELVANGWDNVVARLGHDLAVRVPRRELAVALVEHEVRWLPTLAPRLPVAVPAPVHHGAPDASMPWPWSIVRWVEGVPSDDAPDPTSADAVLMGEFLTALAVPAPSDAPPNPFRGVPLAARDASVRERFDRVRHADHAALVARWEDALAAPPYDGPPRWVHGDLHPANLVARDDRLVGVIDWGDITAGDPAADLQVAWTWAPDTVRGEILDTVGADPAMIRRARGNALAHGLACLASSADNPRMARIGRTTLARVLED